MKKLKGILSQNKKFLLILLSVAVISGAGLTAYALFHDRAVAQANAFSTGDADLKIKMPDNDCPDYVDACPGPNWSGLFPGWSQSYSFYLKNVSSSPLTLQVIPILEETGSSQAMLDSIFMTIAYPDGTHSLGRLSLSAWKSNTGLILGQLNQNQETGPWKATFDIPESVSDEIALANTTFDLAFNGTQMRQYSVAIGINPTAGGSVSGAGMYIDGSTANITATAAAGYLFVNWTGDAVANLNAASTTVLVDADKEITANFRPLNYLTLNPVADSYVDSLQSTANFGLSAYAAVRYSGPEQRGFIKFDLSGIPAGTIVRSATLNLNVYDLTYYNFYSSLSLNISQNRPTPLWAEETITWANQPSYNPPYSYADIAGNGWKAVNVTTNVQSFVNGAVNNGWVLKTYTYQGSLKFRTRENADAGLRPNLVIAY